MITEQQSGKMVPDKNYVQKSKRFHCIHPYGKKLH